MIRKAIVPVPVTGGIGSVFVPGTNSTSGFSWPYLNGKCIQVGLLMPAGNPNGSFYTFDDTNFVPISGTFAGPWNWSGLAGLVGDMTVNVLSNIDGTYAAVFIFEDDR